MTIELCLLLSWIIGGGVIGVIIFYTEDSLSTLGDLILMAGSCMFLGWIAVITSLFYCLGVGISWCCDRSIFKVELKKNKG